MRARIIVKASVHEAEPFVPFGEALVGVAVEGLVARPDAGLDPWRAVGQHQVGALGRHRQERVDRRGVRVQELGPARVPEPERRAAGAAELALAQAGRAVVHPGVVALDVLGAGHLQRVRQRTEVDREAAAGGLAADRAVAEVERIGVRRLDREAHRAAVARAFELQVRLLPLSSMAGSRYQLQGTSIGTDPDLLRIPP